MKNRFLHWIENRLLKIVLQLVPAKNISGKEINLGLYEIHRMFFTPKHELALTLLHRWFKYDAVHEVVSFSPPTWCEPAEWAHLRYLQFCATKKNLNS